MTGIRPSQVCFPAECLALKNKPHWRQVFKCLFCDKVTFLVVVDTGMVIVDLVGGISLK